MWIDDLLLARHGESGTAARGIVGGDAPLTAAGREQALALGRAIAELPVDACLTSPAARARETAQLALGARKVPREVIPALGDIDFGEFEGRPLDGYRRWIAAHGPADAPPAGESRTATLRRLSRAYRTLLERPERHLFVVAHGITLSALADERPRPIVAAVPYGSWMLRTRDETAAALDRLERWLESPAW